MLIACIMRDTDNISNNKEHAFLNLLACSDAGNIGITAAPCSCSVASLSSGTIVAPYSGGAI